MPIKNHFGVLRERLLIKISFWVLRAFMAIKLFRGLEGTHAEKTSFLVLSLCPNVLSIPELVF